MGKLGGQAKIDGVEGTWKELTDTVNDMADQLTHQTRNVASVTTAVNPRTPIARRGDRRVIMADSFRSSVVDAAAPVSRERPLDNDRTARAGEAETGRLHQCAIEARGSATPAWRQGARVDRPASAPTAEGTTACDEGRQNHDPFGDDAGDVLLGDTEIVVGSKAAAIVFRH
jgi:hypothetical protein